MSQETRPQVYPLLPSKDGTMHTSGNEPMQGVSQVMELQPVSANENIPTSGSDFIEALRKVKGFLS